MRVSFCAIVKEGGITMAKLFAYQIGQNPRIQTDLLVDPQLFEDEHGCAGVWTSG